MGWTTDSDTACAAPQAAALPLSYVQHEIKNNATTVSCSCLYYRHGAVSVIFPDRGEDRQHAVRELSLDLAKIKTVRLP